MEDITNVLIALILLGVFIIILKKLFFTKPQKELKFKVSKDINNITIEINKE